jgi:peptidoglycan/xylan/chitin deacetylase (PgdA/CDA1 family)
MVRVVLGFDCETDIGSFTQSYNGVIHGTPAILDVLKPQGITATFFFTGAAARGNPEMVRRVCDSGHEVGCHSLFHETLGEPIFHMPGDYPVLPEEVETRLRRATEMVEEYAGYRPVSFRAPRLWSSTAVLNALENLGYQADASYPMFYFRERLAPYHPSREDWTKEGSLNIVELPNFADLSMESKDPYGRDRDQWPLFRTEGAEALMRHIDAYAGYCRARDTEPFLCFYFHPWEMYPMPQGKIRFGECDVRPDPFIVKNCGPYAVEQLERVIEMLQERGAQFFQARQMAAELAG